MPRDIPTAADTELDKQVVNLCFLAKLVFASETVCIWTGAGDLSYSGSIYTGVGTLGNVSEVVESSAVQANGLTLSLSGIPTALLNDSQGVLGSGQRATVLFGFLDSLGALLAVIPLFAGRIDQALINIGTTTSSIKVMCENRLLDMGRSRGGRYTHNDQQSRYAGDNCLQWVADLQDHRINWG